MDITLGNVSSGSAKDVAAQRAGENRRRGESPDSNRAGGSPDAAKAQTLEIRHSVLEDLRSRLMLLQHDVARAQRALGGLEGIGEILRRPDSQASLEQTVRDYLPGITYRGEPVLRALEGDLARIARERDYRGLETLVEESRDRLGQLAQELSRYETAQQNSRALAAGRDPLESLKQGIQESGGALLELRRENVLRLLG